MLSEANFRPWLLPLLLLIGSLLFYGSLFPLKQHDGILQGFDLREYTYPYFDFMVSEVREHQSLPLWNPHQLAGFSLIGAGEVNPFYPPNWLALIFYTRRAVALNVLVHGFIGMWGAAFLARQLNASYLGALFSGLLWGGSGFIGARIEAGHYMILLPAAWLPWVLATYLGSMKHRSWFYTGASAAAIGLLYLSGHPQMGLIAGMTLLIVWGYWVYQDPKDFWRPTLSLIAVGVVGIALAAIQILPTLETTSESGRMLRVQDRLEFANRYSMPANQLMTFVFPYLLATPEENYGEGNFEELFAYIGLIPLLAVPVLVQRPTKEFWLLIFLIVMSIILSLAVKGGLLRLLIQINPLWGTFRSWARWLVVTQLALACLGGLFITWLQTADEAERTQVLMTVTRTWLPVFIVVCFGLGLILSTGKMLNSPNIWNAGRVASKTGLMLLFVELALLAARSSHRPVTALILLGLVDVWSVTLPLITVGGLRTYDPFWYDLEEVVSPEETGYNRIIVQPSVHQTLAGATGRGYYDVFGYEQLTPELYNQWIASRNPLSVAYRTLGIEYVVRRNPYEEASESSLFEVVAETENYIVYRFKQPVPRAFMAKEIIINPDDSAVSEFYQSVDEDRVFTVTLNEDVPCSQSVSEAIAAEITRYRPNEVTLTVDTPQAGLLFFSDRYAPDWKARVNGQMTQVYKANTLFRAVCVPQGKSEITFTYRPRSLIVGGAVTGISWSALLFFLFFSWRKSRGILSI